MTYQRRIIDGSLDELFPHVAAIAIEGAKGVGKTATASERVNTVVEFDDPAQTAVVAADLDYVTRLPRPVLLDEWTLFPPVWDKVRRLVDEDGAGGQFLLAGSADVPSSARIHSGAGRIISLRMRPQSFAERGLADCTVSFSELLSGTKPAIRG
ncbi:MAG: AAA family ATPase, partial [Actinomycetales bacterium]|nr:AAA family ATPase [Actinomycetales bacterium]